MRSLKLLSGSAALVSLFVATGCGSGSGTVTTVPTPQPSATPGSPFTPVNNFTLQPTLSVLPSDGSVNVKAVTASSVTLSGAVPSLKAGSTILSNVTMPDGTFGLLRKVVSVTPSGGDTVLQTTDADLADVFQTADIHQQTDLPVEAFSHLQSGIPGVSFGQARAAGAAGSRAQSVTLPITFRHVYLQAPDGTVIAELNGEEDVTIGMETQLQLDTVGIGSLQVPKGVKSMLAAPYVRVGGPGVTMTTYVKGNYSKRIGLTDQNTPIEWTVPLGPVAIDLKMGLFAQVDGDFDGTGTVNVNGSINLEAGIGVGSAVGKGENQFGAYVPNPNPQLDISTQGIFPHAHAQLNASLMQGEASIGVAGLGSAFLRADAVRGRLGLDYHPVNGQNAFNYQLDGEMSATIGANLKLLGLVSLYNGQFTPFDYVFNVHNWYTVDTGQTTAPPSIPGQQTGPGNIGITLK